jgi:hypothetical protein
MSCTHERRARNRPRDPECARCGNADAVRASVRTDYVVYFRCAACGNSWAMSKPSWVAALRHGQPATTLGGSHVETMATERDEQAR